MAQGTPCRAQGTWRRAHGTGHRAQGRELRAQSPERARRGDGLPVVAHGVWCTFFLLPVTIKKPRCEARRLRNPMVSRAEKSSFFPLFSE